MKIKWFRLNRNANGLGAQRQNYQQRLIDYSFALLDCYIVYENKKTEVIFNDRLMVFPRA